MPVERTGRWLVQEQEDGKSLSEPESEYDSETAAELHAFARARRRRGSRVVIHDRYHRTREIELGSGTLQR